MMAYVYQGFTPEDAAEAVGRETYFARNEEYINYLEENFATRDSEGNIIYPKLTRELEEGEIPPFELEELEEGELDTVKRILFEDGDIDGREAGPTGPERSQEAGEQVHLVTGGSDSSA
jgi:hypothetical protein